MTTTGLAREKNNVKREGINNENRVDINQVLPAHERSEKEE